MLLYAVLHSVDIVVLRLVVQLVDQPQARLLLLRALLLPIATPFLAILDHATSFRLCRVGCSVLSCKDGPRLNLNLHVL